MQARPKESRSYLNIRKRTQPLQDTVGESLSVMEWRVLRHLYCYHSS
jgi:hypothetical protein